ncbi:MAG: rhodoquinone biosynthesis methyltransferase RquA [Acidiferrobacterales bacterium]
MTQWQRFLNGHPEYLARHYWWAYLWEKGVWFFDHQPVINAILFGQYRNLLDCALALTKKDQSHGRVLQLACVYGDLTPKLLKSIKQELYLADVAQIQLQATRQKLDTVKRARLISARMNAEQLAYCDNAFATTLIFFLLHEMPTAARERTLNEVIRTLKPGGRVIVVEYAPLPKHHVLWRFPPTRAVLMQLEPFLSDFWQEDMLTMLKRSGKRYDKQVYQTELRHFFYRFYRISVFRVG